MYHAASKHGTRAQGSGRRKDDSGSRELERTEADSNEERSYPLPDATRTTPIQQEAKADDAEETWREDSSIHEDAGR